jgi:hypothetical protein
MKRDKIIEEMMTSLLTMRDMAIKTMEEKFGNMTMKEKKLAVKRKRGSSM